MCGSLYHRNRWIDLQDRSKVALSFQMLIEPVLTYPSLLEQQTSWKVVKNGRQKYVWLSNWEEQLHKQQQQQYSLFSQTSWGRLEMKPERNKFKVQTH